MDTGVPPPRADGLSWALQFHGTERQPDWEWLHFDLVHAQARQTIEGNDDLPDFARRVLTGTDESPRIVSDGHVVAGVLPAYARTGDTDQFELTCWHFAMLPHRVVTGRRRPTRTLVKMWESIAGRELPGRPGPSGRSLHCRVRARGACQACHARDQSGSDRGHADRAARCGPTRSPRRSSRHGPPRGDRLKRALIPIARAIDEDEDNLPVWTGFSQHDAEHRLLHSALDDIGALQDRIHSLQDELTTRLAEETNRRLYLVSVVTTVLLPATFVTGFFGMNTGGLFGAATSSHMVRCCATLLCGAAVSRHSWRCAGSGCFEGYWVGFARGTAATMDVVPGGLSRPSVHG